MKIDKQIVKQEFRSANFQGANLQGANLQGAIPRIRSNTVAPAEGSIWTGTVGAFFTSLIPQKLRDYVDGGNLATYDENGRLFVFTGDRDANGHRIFEDYDNGTLVSEPLIAQNTGRAVAPKIEANTPDPGWFRRVD